MSRVETEMPPEVVLRAGELHGEKPPEEGSIAAQCEAQFFSGDAFPSIPLRFQACTLFGEDFSEALDG